MQANKTDCKAGNSVVKDNFLEVQPDTSDLTQRTVTFKVLQDSHVPFRQRKLTVLVALYQNKKYYSFTQAFRSGLEMIYSGSCKSLRT